MKFVVAPEIFELFPGLRACLPPLGGRRVTLRRRLDAVAGPDPAAREHVGPQPAPVHEAAQHPGPR